MAKDTKLLGNRRSDMLFGSMVAYSGGTLIMIFNWWLDEWLFDLFALLWYGISYIYLFHCCADRLRKGERAVFHNDEMRLGEYGQYKNGEWDGYKGNQYRNVNYKLSKDLTKNIALFKRREQAFKIVLLLVGFISMLFIYAAYHRYRIVVIPIVAILILALAASDVDSIEDACCEDYSLNKLYPRLKEEFPNLTIDYYNYVDACKILDEGWLIVEPMDNGYIYTGCYLIKNNSDSYSYEASNIFLKAAGQKFLALSALAFKIKTDVKSKMKLVVYRNFKNITEKNIKSGEINLLTVNCPIYSKTDVKDYKYKTTVGEYHIGCTDTPMNREGIEEFFTSELKPIMDRLIDVYPSIFLYVDGDELYILMSKPKYEDSLALSRTLDVYDIEEELEYNCLKKVDSFMEDLYGIMWSLSE